MSDPTFAPSAALLRSNLVSKPVRDPALMAAFEAGAVPTRGASRGPTQFRLPGVGSLSEARRRRRSADHAAETRRLRTMSASGTLPHSIRWEYTEGERAALSVIALEIKRRGRCELEVKQLADIAGVSVRTVQYALSKARQHGHISVTYRKRSPSRNAPNLIAIVSKEWLAWLKRGPSLKTIEREVSGCKSVHTSENKRNNKRFDKPRSLRTASAAAGGSAAMGLGEGKRGDDTDRHGRGGG
ncbi:hypothetical protein [Pararhizobium mangrovi]|uniref:Helix-turn-helix type 11 domain-containing protein n=1 Tax=Pararhizobium mangrovi TaxID=2590452 RepID=A0A506UHF6_9HYPH|nr:hypothetical protein [Pararhizobium mangrovi]TPW32739.1 hypothetical protein FJU11_00495 [Pararhizobium mangrovi]